jgi:hypothetical protein
MMAACTATAAVSQPVRGLPPAGKTVDVRVETLRTAADAYCYRADDGAEFTSSVSRKWVADQRWM